MNKTLFRSVLMLVLLAAVAVLPVTAQDEDDTTALTADNIDQLQPALTVDFADLPEDINVDSGWFTMSDDGDYIAVVRREGGLVIYDDAGEMVDTYTVDSEGIPLTVLDASFGTDNERIATLHTDSVDYYVSIRNIADEATTLITLSDDVGMPARVWLDEETPHVWLEVLPGGSSPLHTVMRLPLPDAEDQEVLTLPNGPENDEEAFVRIGRIQPPLAVTSSRQGLVKLWDLETGEVIHEVQLDEVPVFGRINETTGQQLAWRDPLSAILYVLDFDTEENVPVAELGGEYIQAIMLTPDADVVLAVDIGNNPIVAYWDVETGEQTVLGEYRECSRIPDMIQLSADGSLLVIGCDAGLEYWRLAEE